MQDIEKKKKEESNDRSLERLELQVLHVKNLPVLGMQQQLSITVFRVSQQFRYWQNSTAESISDSLAFL